MAILVLNWNGWKETAQCLQSLQKLDHQDCRIIVIDNGSTDGSEKALRELFPQLTVLQTGSNLGFAGGMNQGIQHALSLPVDHIWLLNNDIEVKLDCLSKMLLEMADPTVGAVGCVIHDLDSRLTLLAWGGGIQRSRFSHPTHLTRPGLPDYLTGASLLLRCSAARAVGLLDDRFFMYYEDFDYCLRLRASGYRLAVAPDATVWHREKARKDITGRLSWLDWGGLRIVAKHRRWPRTLAATITIARVANRLMRGEFRRARIAVSVWRRRDWLHPSAAPDPGQSKT
ncbi:MAG TPA: glycosyltransferase family 2 protein [Candidatus Thermoplasmatota archaeon]|nr:glycosyltransferase family 2 protein [Candidatus Thermoplasmatota archaeon]